MQKPLILVTGGAGYIGSHAVVAFEEAGYQTIIVDNFSNASRDSLAGIEKILGYCPPVHETDIRDSAGLRAIFQRYNFDGVIHFAGLKAVGESCTDIGRYHENNISGSITLFQIMEEFGVRKIIFSSSATVYRADNISPIHEEMILGTTNPYGTTKLIIEKLLEDYATHAGWSVTALRYFNPLGAHPSGYIGEIPAGVPANLPPYIFDVAVGKREKVFIFGKDYDTEDGTGVRDYIDVNDLVRAHLLAYTHLHPEFAIYNIGTGTGRSVFELIRLVEKVTEKEIPFEVVARRTGDIATVYCDPSKAEKALGFHADTPIEETIRNGWKFIQNQ